MYTYVPRYPSRLAYLPNKASLFSVHCSAFSPCLFLRVEWGKFVLGSQLHKAQSPELNAIPRTVTSKGPSGTGYRTNRTACQLAACGPCISSLAATIFCHLLLDTTHQIARRLLSTARLGSGHSFRQDISSIGCILGGIPLTGANRDHVTSLRHPLPPAGVGTACTLRRGLLQRTNYFFSAPYSSQTSHLTFHT